MSIQLRRNVVNNRRDVPSINDIRPSLSMSPGNFFSTDCKNSLPPDPSVQLYETSMFFWVRTCSEKEGTEGSAQWRETRAWKTYDIKDNLHMSNHDQISVTYHQVRKRTTNLGSKCCKRGTGHFSKASGRTVWFVKKNVLVTISQAFVQGTSSSSMRILINSGIARVGCVCEYHLQFSVVILKKLFRYVRRSAG